MCIGEELEPQEDIVMQEAHKAVVNALKWGAEDGVIVEVILYSMMYLRDNPGKSIPEAISYGLEEWLK